MYSRLPSAIEPPDELTALGVVAQVAAVQAGEVRPRELVDAALARIDRVAGQLNCMRVVRADAARAEADAVEARLRAGESPPLAGVTVAIKDNVAIAGEIHASGTGSPERPASADAEIVRRLRAAGAVIVCTTTMPELALWSSTESETWGTTRNPYDPSRSPGGSSGGSAVAVAARLVALGQGDDGGASLRVPAAYCGLVGLKPQRDRIPTAPHPERWHGLTHYGFLARDAADSRLALACTGAPLPTAKPRPLRIGVVTRPPLPVPVAPEVRRSTAALAERLAALGHEVEDRRPDWGVLGPALVARYLAGAAQERAALADPRAVDRRTRTLTALGARIPGRLLRAARAAEPRHRDRLLAMFGRADVLLMPTTTQPAPPAGWTLERGALRAFAAMAAQIAFTAPWNLTGQPAISVPAGHDARGVPLGAQLVARPGREDLLLALAGELEAATAPTPERSAV